MTGGARRRLWELDVDCHGTIVGISWTAAELRRLTYKLFAGRSPFGDFELHVAVAQQCASRNKVSVALQRDLERRFGDVLQRLDRAADRDALGLQWARALADGEAAAAAWATLSHAQCDEALRTHVLQDLYLLQHERVAGQRAERSCRAELQAQILGLKADAQRAQQRQAMWRSEALAERDALQTQLATLRGRVMAQDALIAQLRERQMPQPEAPRPAPKVERPARPEPAPVQIAAAPPAPEAPPLALADDALQSTRVLCVGGRNGQVPQYRELVERHGGRFAHHDGGIDDPVHGLDAQLAAADAVLCQSGCLNHNAYARVKAYCKRSGTPCVYLDNPGVGSFLRGLAQLPHAAAR